MAGVGVGFAKCFILFMAIVILLQGGVYLGLSIWGITQRDCQTATDVEKEPFQFALDLIYFMEQDCGAPVMQYGGEEWALSMDWSKSYKVTHREYIFMITYAAISGLWVVTSLLVLATLCSTTTKVISGSIYWPWFIAVILGSILDVVATVYHAIDITNTLSLQDAFNYIGASLPDLIPNVAMTQLETYGVYFSTPAILLTCLSCRVVLIWLLNLFGVSFCLSLSRILASQSQSKSQRKAASIAASEAPTRQQTPQPQPVKQVEVVESFQKPQQPQYADQLEYPEQIRPKPLPIIMPAQNLEQRTTLQSPVAILPPQSPQQQSPFVVAQPQSQPDINTYRTTEAHPDRLNYPPTEASAPAPAVQQLAAGSMLNNRYSEAYPLQAQPNPRVSEELRNQMPWSYTSMITKPPPPPRKPQQQVQIYPQIPEPDYVDY